MYIGCHDERDWISLIEDQNISGLPSVSGFMCLSGPCFCRHAVNSTTWEPENPTCPVDDAWAIGGVFLFHPPWPEDSVEVQGIGFNGGLGFTL